MQSSNAGAYSVIVSNSFGAVTNSCCVIVDPPQLRCQVLWTNSPVLLNISSVLAPGCVLQSTTNLLLPISWKNLVTNTTFLLHASGLLLSCAIRSTLAWPRSVTKNKGTL